MLTEQVAEEVRLKSTPWVTCPCQQSWKWHSRTQEHGAHGRPLRTCFGLFALKLGSLK